MHIITHRGLDPSKEPYFLESSVEAFADQLKRGFGLEFDLQFTDDEEIVIFHDSNLKRISGGEIDTEIRDLNVEEVARLEFNGCHLTTLEPLLELIEEADNDAPCAIHVKHRWQEPFHLKTLLEKLHSIDPKRFILFDLKPHAALYLKTNRPDLELAPSVSHPFDVIRYNAVVGGTLLTPEETLRHKDIYTWVWLDEWDRTNENGGSKSLYNGETFSFLRENGFRIALVTPELHATSPGLLGEEAHQDAKDPAMLEKRFQHILSLEPDAVCTDYPDLVRNLIST